MFICFLDVQTKLHSVTKLKKIIQDAKESVVESDLRQRMQPLKELLANTINQLHAVLETQVFVMICRGFWDRMGQVELSSYHKINLPYYDEI